MIKQRWHVHVCMLQNQWISCDKMACLDTTCMVDLMGRKSGRILFMEHQANLSVYLNLSVCFEYKLTPVYNMPSVALLLLPSSVQYFQVRRFECFFSFHIEDWGTPVVSECSNGSVVSWPWGMAVGFHFYIEIHVYGEIWSTHSGASLIEIYAKIYDFTWL